MPATALTGAAIAADALRWKGRGYVYGGTGSRPGDWDCSSFASYVLGHDLGLSLPGGSWAQVTRSGTQHGPVVVSYATWPGAVTIAAGSATAGDLVLFVGLGAGGHMGIVLAPGKMISALDSASGTLVTPINGYGPPGAPVVYRRVKGAAAGPIPAVPGPGGTGWGGMLLALAAGAGIGAGIIVLIVGAAVAVAAGAVWLAGRAGREMMG